MKNDRAAVHISAARFHSSYCRHNTHKSVFVFLFVSTIGTCKMFRTTSPFFSFGGSLLVPLQ
jgi:hypothetical protein